MSENSRIDVLTERIENWFETTNEYRRSLCSKIDKIDSRLNDLPCGTRSEISRSLRNDLGWLQRIVYTILCVGIPALMGIAMVWGSMNTTVERDHQRWTQLDKERGLESKVADRLLKKEK